MNIHFLAGMGLDIRFVKWLKWFFAVILFLMLICTLNTYSNGLKRTGDNLFHIR
jgi:hypothetical protein